MRNTEKAACGHLLVIISTNHQIYMTSAKCTLTNKHVLIAAFFFFSLSVMNLDRVENRTHVRRRFPRYHTTLFRGQALWDPYTHVILPPAALVSQRQQQHNWKEKERTEKDRKNTRTNQAKGLRV